MRAPHLWAGLLLLFVVILAIQAVSGTLGAELASADEPAHFISGLMVRDYIASGFPGAPVEYARDYYAHYPKIAIGNWPPLFYALEGLWLLLLPPHPVSVQLLLVLFTAMLGLLVFAALRPLLGTWYAAFGAGLLMLLRPVLLYAGMVMLENVLALLATAAMLLWARYLAGGGFRFGIAFAVVAVLAVLTKNNALFLAAVPPLTILLARRWDILRRRGLWLGLLIVLLVAGPWVWYVFESVRTGWHGLIPTPAYVARALGTFGVEMWRALSLAGVALALIGIWTRVVRPPAGADAESAVWVSALALIIAVLAFHALVPAGIDPRHLNSAYPALAMFAAAGAYHATAWLRTRGIAHTRAAAMVLGGALAIFAVQSFQLPHRPSTGYRAAALEVLEHARPGEPATALIVSNTNGEGAFAVEMAVRDEQRPGHVVWRGSNLLVLSTWAGRGYQLRAASEAEVLALLERAAVQFIVIDGSRLSWHQQQLADAMAANASRFERVAVLPLVRNEIVHPRALALYRVRAGAEAAPRIRQVPGYDGVAQVRDD